ncbi:alpha/beta hydrolase family protein [Mycobacterium stomatepiae]
MPTEDDAHQRGVLARGAPAGALGGAITPFVHTGQYITRSWRDYLGGPDELPIARPTIALAAQAFRDEIVLMGLKARRPVSRPEDFARITREVTDAVAFYGNKGWLDKPQGFFGKPPELSDVEIRKVKDRRRSFHRTFFGSGYAPHAGEPGAQRWLSYSANNREYALLLRHPEPRPWLVCVHGTEMGRAALDLALFRSWKLHDELGLNVVMPVLPMHGPRSHGLPKGAVFPGEDVLDDVHATAQAVWDIRRLLSWIRLQEPESLIGLNSLSLGGYVASLVASLDKGLTCAILGVPVADLVELLGRHSGLGPDDPRRQTMELAEPIGRMVSPLSLTPLVPMRGRFIYAGIADRVVHPRRQVTRLWEHWGKPEIVWYRGGHTGFFRSQPVQRFVWEALLQSGLLDAAATQRYRPA